MSTARDIQVLELFARLDDNKDTARGELCGRNSEGFQFFATPDEWSGIVTDTSVVEDQDLEWRDRRIVFRREEGIQIGGLEVG